MAQEGQRIENPATGQTMHFVRLTEEEFVIESTHPPTELREPTHVHPRQQSGAEVVDGALVFELDGERRVIGAGQSIDIPPGTPHRFWNESGAEARSIQTFRPALDIA